MFLLVLSEKLRLCTTAEAYFELDDKVTHVFKPNMKVPLAAIRQVDNELDRLKENGIIDQVDCAKRAAPTKSPWSKIHIEYAGQVSGT